MKPASILELLTIIAMGSVVFIIAGRFDLLERMLDIVEHHEHWELDEVISTSVFFAVALGVFSWRRWRETINMTKTLQYQNDELTQAFSEIKQLKGILPICASCKKIRDDKGYWHQVEAYVREHTDADFSHGLCPDCMKKLYPDLFPDDE